MQHPHQIIQQNGPEYAAKRPRVLGLELLKSSRNFWDLLTKFPQGSKSMLHRLINISGNSLIWHFKFVLMVPSCISWHEVAF